MTTIALEKAQGQLAALVQRALAGEDIVIAADDKQVRLSPVEPAPAFDEQTARRRGYGSMKGQFEVAPEFFEPLPDDELRLWEGRSGT